MQMDQLKQASATGDVEVLKSLIRDDNFILDKVSLLSCCNETPLHMAALLGHLEFVGALVVAKPELASVVDMYGRSPLHLACSKGYVDIVRLLSAANFQVCLSRDQDGRTPLHLAALNDQVHVVKALIEMAPELARESMLDEGETVLHLCVKHRRVKTLELLLKWEWGDGDMFINTKDHNGNTILHLAAMLKDSQTTEYLLSRNEIKMKEDAVNDNGLTALDISEQLSPSDFKSQKIRKLLRQAAFIYRSDDSTVPGALPPSPSRLILPVSTPSTDKTQTRASTKAGKIALMLWNKYLKSESKWFEGTRNNLLVAATVTATMAFQAGLNPPGGVWQQFGQKYDPYFGDVKMTPGYSVAASLFPDEYSYFVNYNTVSLVASLSTILLMIGGFPLKSRFYVWLLMVAMCTTVIHILRAYLTALYLLCDDENKSFVTTLKASKISAYIWMGLCGAVILLHTLRFLVWLVKTWRARPYYWMKLNSS